MQRIRLQFRDEQGIFVGWRLPDEFADHARFTVHGKDFDLEFPVLPEDRASLAWQLRFAAGRVAGSGRTPGADKLTRLLFTEAAKVAPEDPDALLLAMACALGAVSREYAPEAGTRALQAIRELACALALDGVTPPEKEDQA